MRIVLALNMYHYKVRVLNAKFDIDRSNRMIIEDHVANQNKFQPALQPAPFMQELLYLI